MRRDMKDVTGRSRWWIVHHCGQQRRTLRTVGVIINHWSQKLWLQFFFNLVPDRRLSCKSYTHTDQYTYFKEKSPAYVYACTYAGDISWKSSVLSVSVLKGQTTCVCFICGQWTVKTVKYKEIFPAYVYAHTYAGEFFRKLLSLLSTVHVFII